MLARSKNAYISFLRRIRMVRKEDKIKFCVSIFLILDIQKNSSIIFKDFQHSFSPVLLLCSTGERKRQHSKEKVYLIRKQAILLKNIK